MGIKWTVKNFLNIQWNQYWVLFLEEKNVVGFSSVQFSHSVVSDSWRPHELQHARPPYPSPTSGVHPNPCPLSRWCYPAISSFVIPFSSGPQSFPTSGSFQMSQFFASGGQSIDLFQRLKIMLWKCCTQYASKFGKLRSGHRPGKGQFLLQSQRKAMPKNAQTTAQLQSSHMLVE